MLLTPISEATVGAVVAAAVRHPARAETELLRPGTALTSTMIDQLKRLRIRELWLEAEGATDITAEAAARLTDQQREVYTKLKADMSVASGKSVSAARVVDYRRAVMNLVCEAVAGRDIAGLSYRMLTADGELFAHSASVAYLAVVVGLELEAYLIKSRARLNYREARDVVGLGLAGMLHDIGKAGDDELESMHEATLPEGPPPEAYAQHSIKGYQMLAGARLCPAARNAILMHHRRWEGTGWPEPRAAGLRTERDQSGVNLHIFTRIVAAVNVLDNLLCEADAEGKPAVHAMAAFLSRRFDGWFDPVVRWGVARTIPPYAVGALVTLTDGRPAGIATPNRDFPCRPTVRLLGRASGETPLLDLTQHPDIRIATCGGRDVGGLEYNLPPRAGAVSAPSVQAA